MPRPIKLRKVGFIPTYKLFIPYGKSCIDKDIVILKHEELEAMRLKDIEKLHQDECAEIIDVSRQTLQLILESARTKVTHALINGLPIKIEGGDFIETPCVRRCFECGNMYSELEKPHCRKKCCSINKQHCPTCCKNN